MLPKLEIHFGNEVLHIPQNKKVNLITFAYGKESLKENIIESYRIRAIDARIEAGEDFDYDDVTLKDAEEQLIKDLKEFGDEYVFNISWQAGDSRIVRDSHQSMYEWISDEEELFEGKIE